MEIERKWMVTGWPGETESPLPLVFLENQEQGYLHTQAPVVRLRKETRSRAEAIEGQPGAKAVKGQPGAKAEAESVTKPEELYTRYVLCVKSAGFLSREEIEIELSEEDFRKLSDLTGFPLIKKERRIYRLPGNLELEVNLVDAGLPTEFMYAEVEFSDEEAALKFDPASCGLENYLSEDVTQQPGQSMSAFWARTRLNVQD